MGNHEYCTGCGASDFHSGESCEQAYPERWAKKQAERKAAQAIVDKENQRVKKLVRATVKRGKQAIVRRITETHKQRDILDEKIRLLEAKKTKLYNERKELSKHCPHPIDQIDSGFFYTSCNICGETDV